MDNKFAQQLKKGVLDMVVLRLVEEKSTYGYEIIQQLEQRGEGFFNLKEGTLYPVLYRLEDSGLIESFWQNGEGRTAPKKYYTITEKAVRHTGNTGIFGWSFKTVSHIYAGREINDRGSEKD